MAVLLSSGALWGEGGAALRFLDDRGLPIQEELEACYLVETQSVCSTIRNGSPSVAPLKAVSVRVEGARHGPATFARAKWEALAAGSPSLTVPRKARLEIRARAGERLTVSLYPQDDPDFRRPIFRSELVGGGTVWVPAGAGVASMLAPGRAPDLHLADAAPGGRELLRYRPTSGWSLVLRCRSAQEGRLVAGAAIALSGAEGYTPPGTAPRTGRSSLRGLALFSGIPFVLATAEVKHPDFASSAEQGVSASAGTFAFREVALEKGGALRIAVKSEGRKVPGIRCQVLQYDGNPIGPTPEPAVHSDTLTDGEGVCRAGPIAAGPYTVRLRLTEGRTFLDRSVSVQAGEETALEILFQTIRVHGKVLRGSHPAASYRVLFSDRNEVKPNATDRDAQAETATNDEGEYETQLWSEGDYFAILKSPSETPSASKRVRLEEGDEQVDFLLSEQRVGGVVLDERDRPIPEASVVLRWHGLVRVGKTDPRGAFFFDLTEEGEGELMVSKSGYFPSPEIAVAVRAEAPPEPRVVHLKRAGLLTGRVLARGPVAGASLLGYRLEAGGSGGYLGTAISDGEGRFELAAGTAGPSRIFVTGPGCPLTSFTVEPSTEELTLQCPDLPASAVLEVEDRKGRPLAGKSILARREGVVIPTEVLSRHLAQLRLPSASDGRGRLRLVGLAPGSYDFFLANATSPDLVAAGSAEGFLTSASLLPLSTTELEVTLEESP